MAHPLWWEEGGKGVDHDEYVNILVQAPMTIRVGRYNQTLLNSEQVVVKVRSMLSEDKTH